MADNRIFMTCAGCGEKLFLGKRIYNGYYYRNYLPEKGSLEDRLNDFYDKHECCNGRGFDCFRLEYELPYEVDNREDEPE